MARELAPHRQVVPPATVDTHYLAKMLQEHMYRLECMMKNMQRSIPIFVDEYLYMQNATTLTLLPQSQNMENITAIFAVVTASGGATLSIGSPPRTIPLPQGNSFFLLGDYGMTLNNGDSRVLTQASAGLLGLELFGYEIPDKGPF